MKTTGGKYRVEFHYDGRWNEDLHWDTLEEAKASMKEQYWFYVFPAARVVEIATGKTVASLRRRS